MVECQDARNSCGCVCELNHDGDHQCCCGTTWLREDAAHV